MSAPNSTALTTLTSPSTYNESPDFDNFDNFDVSPNFGTADFDTADPWFPLFPQESAGMEQQKSQTPFPQQTSDSSASPIERASVPATRRRPSDSPASPAGRHSSVAGVNARKRDKPLPDIIIEDANDTTAMKRARNTLAARKSRERKAQRFEDLEDRIAKLEAERDHWKRLALGQSDA